MAEFVDPYIDPETGVLRNLLGITSGRELESAGKGKTSRLSATITFTVQIR